MQLLIRNARQILGVAAAAFGEELFDLGAEVDPCSDTKGDADKLACDWRHINQQLSSFSSYEDVSPEWVDQVTEVRAIPVDPDDIISLLTIPSGYALPKTS